MGQSVCSGASEHRFEHSPARPSRFKCCNHDTLLVPNHGTYSRMYQVLGNYTVKAAVGKESKSEQENGRKEGKRGATKALWEEASKMEDLVRVICSI